MPQPTYSYTVVLETGDQNVKTKDHHSDHDTLESWMIKNMPFKVALKPGDQGTLVKEIYEGIDRSGKKIR